MSIQEDVNNLLIEKEVLNKSLDEVVAGAELEKKALEERNAGKDEEISSLVEEASKTSVATEQLKVEIEERIENEANLSKQISELEKQLREQTESASTAAEKAKVRLDELEKDRQDLRKTVGALTEKLQTVAGFLDDMSNEQDAIIEQAGVHEAEMQAATKEHARILDQVNKQHELDAKAQASRETIQNMIRQHENMYLSNTWNRELIVESVDLENAKIAEGAVRREKLVNNVKALQDKIHMTRERVLGGLPDLQARVLQYASHRLQREKAKEVEEQQELEDARTDQESIRCHHNAQEELQSEDREQKSGFVREKSAELREEMEAAATTPSSHQKIKGAVVFSSSSSKRVPVFEDEKKKTAERKTFESSNKVDLDEAEMMTSTFV